MMMKGGRDGRRVRGNERRERCKEEERVETGDEIRRERCKDELEKEAGEETGGGRKVKGGRRKKDPIVKGGRQTEEEKAEVEDRCFAAGLRNIRGAGLSELVERRNGGTMEQPTGTRSTGCLWCWRPGQPGLEARREPGNPRNARGGLPAPL